MKSDILRQRFIDFFESREHTFIPSSPMVVKDDPTLLFVNAGMNQFKDIFLGNKESIVNSAVNSQKCLRVSGKHNDLDEVGYDTYHHTMFEMLGNWSFGDYFKQNAISFAWEFLVKELKISEEKLYVTFFEGDKKDNLKSDDETKNIWSQIIHKDKIVPGSKKDNFWEMGKIGPCGPCTEIHIDLRPDIEIKNTPTLDLINKDHPQVIEIWNIVFVEFNRNENGTLSLLPQKHVDTGMGFERLCMVMQNKVSTYDTDVFSDLITSISNIANVKYGNDQNTDIAIRVIVDHIRAIGFSIADGQLPSNTGAGYVIRRILRRAVRYGYTYLNLKTPFLYKLIDVLVANFRNIFSDIDVQKSMIKNVIKEEEDTFLKTLGKGLDLINNSLKRNKTKKINGADVFELYDTYGFPPDLTELILKEKGLSYNQEQFDKEMEKQKKRSRSASEINVGDWVQVNSISIDGFVGYDYQSHAAKIVKYRKASVKGHDRFHIVFDKTPFYPEGGGQIGDTGVILPPEGYVNPEKNTVIDTKKENNMIIHVVDNLPSFGPENSMETYMLMPDNKRRQLIARNHSATHLLHHELRNMLGNHVEQKGSYVGADYLRFDFSHFEKINQTQIIELEKKINNLIIQSVDLKEFRNISLDEAKKMGALAFFGEKYDDRVRAIQFGNSIELCGGTHVANTAEIGFIKIISEFSIASGIRRIEAKTSKGAIDFVNQKINTLLNLQYLFKNTDNIIGAAKKIINENKELSILANEAKNTQASDLMDKLSNNMIDVNGLKLVLSKVDMDVGVMKNTCFQLISKYDNLVVALVTNKENRVILNIALSKQLVHQKKLDASQIINKVGAHINARGGGQPFFAVASGNNMNGVQNIFDDISKMIKDS